LAKILDHGFIELVQHVGSDALVCDAARVSIENGERSSEYSRARDSKLLEYLATNMHSGPFEQCFATFRVKMPLFVANQWTRHRTCSFNFVSGRYSSKIWNEYYIPTLERLQTEQSEASIQAQGAIKDASVAYGARQLLIAASNEALSAYQTLISMGTSKELARCVLPMNIYTSAYISANLFNWIRFLKLRLDNHAQYEIRIYAQHIDKILKSIYPISMQSWAKYIHADNICGYSDLSIPSPS
jgi:thymidylate synthase (FAD)